MPDIFGKSTQYKGTNLVTADEMVLTVGTSGGGGALTEYLVQNVVIQYNQPLNRLYEIGSPYVYFAPGRPMGTAQIGRIIGSQVITGILGAPGQGVWTTKVEAGGEAARTATFRRVASTTPGIVHRSGTGINLNFRLTGFIIESWGVSTDANGMLVQENVSAQFASLSFS